MQILIFILGACVGSFANVLAIRTTESRNYIFGRSKCPKCDSQIHWYDNLPLISFLLLKGRCRQCKETISMQYPVVELVMGILAVVFYVHNSSFLPYILLMGMGTMLLAIALTDLKEKFIYESHLYSLLAFSIFYRYLIIDVGIMDTLLGVGLFGGFLLCLRFIGRIIYKREAMGVGDIKMGFILGILFDWQLAVVALYLSFISASIVGVYLLLFKKKQIKILPFAPFIAFGSILSVVYGNKIIYAFLSII